MCCWLFVTVIVVVVGKNIFSNAVENKKSLELEKLRSDRYSSESSTDPIFEDSTDRGIFIYYFLFTPPSPYTHSAMLLFVDLRVEGRMCVHGA